MITFGDVEIKEVAVEDGLYASSHDRDKVEKTFHIITINPVQDVQRSVDSQRKQIVACYRLRLASLADHEKLRKDCHRLEVYRKRPQNLCRLHDTTRL